MKHTAKNKQAREFYRSFYKGNKLLWLATMIMTLVIGPLELSFSWLLGKALDVMLTGDIHQVYKLIGTTVLLLVAVGLSNGIYLRLKAQFVHRALRNYKKYAFLRISEKSISAFSRENTGRYISVLTNDIGSIEENYLNRTFIMVYYIFTFVGSGVMMFWYSPVLALITICFSSIPMIVSIVMGHEMEKREIAVSNQNEGFVSRVKDLLTGFSVLKSFKAEAAANALFDRENQAAECAKLRRRWWDCLLSVIQSGCMIVIQMGIMITGGILAINGRISLGVTMTVMNLVNSFVGPISIVPQYWVERRGAKALINKLAELTSENKSRSGEVIPAKLDDRITLNNVSFGYEADKQVLREINLSLKSGKKYAIVGSSGSGKTTLLNLLMGAYDNYEGKILFDGKELRGIDPDSLYDLMSLIGQNVFLFDANLRENITMFRQFPDEAVDSAVEHSGLRPVLVDKGDDYRCGENGIGLSGGERQRVSIARCLLRGTSVLMLDEATASLDNQTAFEVTQAILDQEGMTRIVVTHRLEETLLRQYDEIIVLRNGRVVEQGTYEDLMEKTGYFYSLYNVSNP